jgi:hypothetical protein
MKAVEFKAKLKNNRIQIPTKFRKQMTASQNKDVRVIVFIDEPKAERDFSKLTQEQFLKGYAKSDAIYDN